MAVSHTPQLHLVVDGQSVQRIFGNSIFTWNSFQCTFGLDYFLCILGYYTSHFAWNTFCSTMSTRPKEPPTKTLEEMRTRPRTRKHFQGTPPSSGEEYSTPVERRKKPQPTQDPPIPPSSDAEHSLPMERSGKSHSTSLNPQQEPRTSMVSAGPSKASSSTRPQRTVSPEQLDSDSYIEPVSCQVYFLFVSSMLISLLCFVGENLKHCKLKHSFPIELEYNLKFGSGSDIKVAQELVFLA